MKGWLIAAAVLVSSVALPAVLAPVAGAQSNAGQQLLDGAGGTGQEGGPEVEDTIKTITNVLLFIIGAVAVIVIIAGGVMYTVSGGDAGRAKSAKDTIFYAVIGLIVALVAYAVVNFVINQFST